MEIDPFEVPLADKAGVAARALAAREGRAACEVRERSHRVPWGAQDVCINRRIAGRTDADPNLACLRRHCGSRRGNSSRELATFRRCKQVGNTSAYASIAKDARRLADEAVKKLKSPSVTAGKTRSHSCAEQPLAHDSRVGRSPHRARSHSRPRSQICGDVVHQGSPTSGSSNDASDIVTLYADKTVPGGLASCGWDDDGVATQKWDLVKAGTLVGLQTTRDQAAFIERRLHVVRPTPRTTRPFRSSACPMSHSRHQRRTRRCKTSSQQPMTALLITGNGSWSIDHQRYNFQFSGQVFHEIKGGKITHALRDVAYQANTLQFWSSCDLIGGTEKRGNFTASLWDGKGEPMQSNAVSHAGLSAGAISQGRHPQRQHAGNPGSAGPRVQSGKNDC